MTVTDFTLLSVTGSVRELHKEDTANWATLERGRRVVLYGECGVIKGNVPMFDV
jgi:hypothetical protein